MKEYTENGRSMLEMLGVLAVIGVITIGGFGMVTKMNDQRETTQIMDYAGELANKARILIRDYDNSSSFPAVFTSYMHDGKAYPSDLTYYEEPGNKIYRLYGKNDEYYVVYAQLEDSPTLYTVGIFNLKESVCMELATKNWGSPSTNGFVGLSVNGFYGTVNNYIANGTENPRLSIVGDSKYPVPMLAATAATYCVEEGEPASRKIYLTFK